MLFLDDDFDDYDGGGTTGSRSLVFNLYKRCNSTTNNMDRILEDDAPGNEE